MEDQASLNPAAGAVSGALLQFYDANARDLPWRNTRDPYAIWVSEIMLQQTRVTTVIPYYRRWLQRFPSPQALATAPEDEVLAAWSGLGYYTRARNLHKGARDIQARYDGRLPTTAKELRTIPGIGPYTAGAIASIAFGETAAVVDGNVIRVLSRVYNIDLQVGTTAMTKAMWRIAEQLVPSERPADHNQALMELGATICAPTPKCMACPLVNHCRAKALGRHEALPVRAKRKKPQELVLLRRVVAWSYNDDGVLFMRRRPNGLYGGMWELPQAATRKDLAALVGQPLSHLARRAALVESATLTHRQLELKVYPTKLVRAWQFTAGDDYDAAGYYSLDDANSMAISSPTRAILSRHQELSQ